MSSLSTELRTQLARAIVAARRACEAGAHKALEALAVARHEPYGSMSPGERRLRTRLRARGRQLGDRRDTVRGTQVIERLTREVAYEHWHRMLFARFLAENNLLIEPESGVPISMEECEELARECGDNPMAMASRFAQSALPEIFRPDDPVFEMTLAPETQQALDRLLTGLPKEVFTSDDALGWTYQYWQSERKNEINQSGEKIGADELPAMTQLFTEHYMVQFLFHNTIGAWRAGKILAGDADLADKASSEEELRQTARLKADGGYVFSYLRFVRERVEGDGDSEGTGPWRPAAGAFEGWPKQAKEIKVLDPCCGSGHFLVEGFRLLTRLRMEEEGLSLEDAASAVIADNLHGLEIDPRCTQIAAFNLALEAWKLVGRPMALPPFNIACSGLAVGASRKDWVAVAGDDDRLRSGMERLYDLFEQAPELGSLIDPKGLSGDLFQAGFGELQPLLERVLEREDGDYDCTEQAVAAWGMARAAELLSDEYTLVITNVPYLARGRQSAALTHLADKLFEHAKGDLATIFVSRIFDFLNLNSTASAVTPQNWLFLTTYFRMREMLLTRRKWDLVARLGPGAFETISGQVVSVALVSLSAGTPSTKHSMAAIDASGSPTPEGKSMILQGTANDGLEKEIAVPALRLLDQGKQLEHPDSRIVLNTLATGRALGNCATALSGCMNGDSRHYVRDFWEIPVQSEDWEYYQSTVERTCRYGGRSEAIFWEREQGEMHHLAQSVKGTNHAAQNWLRGKPNWKKNGVVVSLMGNLPATIYTGDRYDNNCCAIVPVSSDASVSSLWSFCSSSIFADSVREIDQKLNVTNATLIKVPFDLAHWQKVAAEKYPNGLPEPSSDNPTQWLFHGHPSKAEPHTALQVGVARLLGYRWPSELDLEMRLAKEARALVARCEPLLPLADHDGIVCLCATRGEPSAADRLRYLLAAAFEDAWSAARERELLSVAGGSRKPSASLEDWLRDGFFEEHCRLFQHRPFIWHIWDGRRDGFHALINYHRLAGPEGEGRRTLEALTYSYLGDWIERQKGAQAEGLEGADARLAAALDLQGQLKLILVGEPPLDIFVRWKPLADQPVGWEPDINDGVRLNIRPFMKAQLRAGGRKGAGILRWKPNVHWKKDRGKEPQSLRPKAEFPWFWSCPGTGRLADRTDFNGGGEFDGNRFNDLHYTVSFRQAARAQADEESES